MAPLPKAFSVAAQPIASAISEGRSEDAMHKLAAILEGGHADRAVQRIAAEWIVAIGLHPGDAKKLRDGRASLPKEWMDIGEMVERLQDGGESYDSAIRKTVEHFGYKERHTQRCAAMWKAASVQE